MAKTTEYPSDSIQSLCRDWWVRQADPPAVERAALVWAILPHVTKEYFTLEVLGRGADRDHASAEYRLQKISVNQPARDRRLPVAALIDIPGEDRLVFRAKRRPALLLNGALPEVDKRLRGRARKWQTDPTVIVAPYYTCDDDATGGAWDSTFVQRIRRGYYAQFLWDRSPLDDRQAVLRLDHMQPVGNTPECFRPTGWRLSDEAQAVILERIDCMLLGEAPANGLLELHQMQVTEVVESERGKT